MSSEPPPDPLGQVHYLRMNRYTEGELQALIPFTRMPLEKCQGDYINNSILKALNARFRYFFIQTY